MAYDVEIIRQGHNAVIDMQGDAGAIADWAGSGLPPFPDRPNRFCHREDLQLCWIAPDRWLLRAPIERETRLLDITKPATAPLEISVVQVSDSLCFFELCGAEAGEIVSIGCTMDHHPSVFPDNAVSYTNLFGIKGLLLRCPGGFEFAVESSFADMIEDYLVRANT